VFADDLQDMVDDPGALEGVRVIRIETNDMPLRIQGDATLSGRVHLDADAGSQAPTLTREADELVLYQQGRYRGSPAVLRVPLQGCPPIEGSHDKGDVTLDQVVAPISLSHGAGDVRTIGGQGELALRVGKGDVSVEARTGMLALKLGMGDARVSRGTGLLAVSLGKGDIIVDACDGDVALKSGMGDVTASDCSGALTIKSGAGDVTVNRPRHQSLTINNANGDVAVRNGAVTALRVKTGRGDITSTAALVYQAGAGDIASEPEDEDIEAGLGEEPLSFDDIRREALNLADLVRSRGLEFDVSDKGVRFAGGPLAFEASEEGVRFGKGAFRVEISEEGIRVNRGDEGKSGAFDVATGKGDIAIAVPGGIPVRVEALVNGGDVESDIPLVSVGRPGPRGTIQRFVGVSGAPTATDRLNLRVRTDRGDIRIRSTTGAPVPPSPPRPRSPQPPVPPQPPAAPLGFAEQPTQRVAPPPPPSREERMRVILDALSRGELSVSDAERQLTDLERGG
jgi:DUF4097 and DUF4098 domain-containing protein YvlB